MKKFISRAKSELNFESLYHSTLQFNLKSVIVSMKDVPGGFVRMCTGVCHRVQVCTCNCLTSMIESSELMVVSDEKRVTKNN